MTRIREWGTVRIAGELIEPLEKLIDAAEDEFGLPRFQSKCDAVTKAVSALLRKYKGEIGEEKPK